jgi:hypothetical protein
LCHPDSGYPYWGYRVELNAFTSDQMIEWLEAKLEQHQIRKMIPDPAVLEDAYRRATQLHYLNSELRKIKQTAQDKANTVTVPDDLAEQSKTGLDADPHGSWDGVLADLAAEAANERLTR